MTAIKDSMEGVSLKPAEVRLQEAAIAVLVERIASLDKEVKDDLAAVLMEAIKCTGKQELREVEQTLKELIFPGLTGTLIKGQAGDADGAVKLEGWTKSVGEKIKQFREGKGWTQQDLAEKADMLQSHISKLETGQHSPSHKTLVALSKALGVEINQIDPAAS